MIIQGESRAEELVKMVHERTLNKHGHNVSLAALSGFVTGVDRDMLRFYMEECELYERQRMRCIEAMEAICQINYKLEKKLLETIPGISGQSAMCIISETGCDMKAFLTASALVGWAGLRPRNEMSTGKIKGRKITHGNRFPRIYIGTKRMGSHKK